MEAERMTPRDYLEIIKRRRLNLILPFIVIIIASIILALALPPIYKSTSTILIEQQDIPQDFVMSAVTTYAEQQVQIINQRIMSAPRLLEIINKFDLYKKFRNKWTTEEIISKMRDDINLEPISVETVDRRTGRPTVATIAFTLSYEAKETPAKVQQITTVLSSLFLEENVQVRKRQATELSKFLEDEMIKVKEDLSMIDSTISQYKESHMNELPELLEVNIQNLNNIEMNIERYNEQLAHLKEREGVLQAQLAGIPPDFEEANRKRLDELKVHLVYLQNKFSDEYPDVIKTKSEITKLEEQFTGPSHSSNPAGNLPDNPAYITLSAQLASVKSEIDSLKAQIRDLESRRDKYSRRIEATPHVEEAYNALLMERNNTQAKYDDLMRKLMEARVSQGLEKEQKGERFTLIEPASFPEKPYKPNRMAIILIGLILGLGASIGSASFFEYSDDSIRSAERLSILTGFPVLASIPIIITDEDMSLQKTRRTLLIILLPIAIISIALTVHFFVIDLDILWIKLLRRMAF